jgi:hypothetical protein
VAEDRLLFEKFTEFGPKWAFIETYFNGRSEANIKNRWAQLTAKTSSVVEERRALVQGLDRLIGGGKAGAKEVEEKPAEVFNAEEELALCAGELTADWRFEEEWDL